MGWFFGVLEKIKDFVTAIIQPKPIIAGQGIVGMQAGAFQQGGVAGIENQGVVGVQAGGIKGIESGGISFKIYINFGGLTLLAFLLLREMSHITTSVEISISGRSASNYSKLGIN